MYFSTPGTQRIIDEIVADHLVRTNASEEAIQLFVTEAGLEYPLATQEAYKEMHRIVQAIEVGDLWPALR